MSKSRATLVAALLIVLPVAATLKKHEHPPTLFSILFGLLMVRLPKVRSGAVLVFATWVSLRRAAMLQTAVTIICLIDVNEPLDATEPIPQDKNHLHFGAGQTEARIELPPGKHTLQLVLGDAKHYLFNPPVISKKIAITVK